jgi:hypothetical protein
MTDTPLDLDYIEHRMASPMVTYRESVEEDMPALVAALRKAETAHAALVADLRALHKPRTEVMSGSSDPNHVPMTRQVCSFCGDNYGCAPYPCATAALLDRHAPTTGATP